VGLRQKPLALGGAFEVNARLRRQLRSFKGQIERRLERENARGEHDGRPVLRGTGAGYEIASRVRAVAAGGIGLMHQMAQAIGLDREIDRRVSLLRIHAPYEESDHVLNITFNSLAGGECLDHLELLRNDVNYMDMLGARRIPDPTTAGDFCRRFKWSGDIDDLQIAINKSRLRVWSSQPKEFFEHALIDADGTFVETTGDCKKGADFSYKKGFGYHPLVVSLANTQEVLFLENRSGSRPSHEGAAARLDQAVELVKRGGFRKVTLRGDTDFSQTKFLDGWDEDGVGFVFGYEAAPNLVLKAESLQKADWSELKRENRYEIKTAPRSRPVNIRERVVRRREYHNIRLLEEHVAEFSYRPSACARDYRMVVVRKLLSHEEGQKLLFPEHRYFFYITNNRKDSARQIVRFANTRCDQERLIGIQKSEVNSLRCPLDSLLSNWAYMVATTLAWNMTRWFALLLPEEGRWKDKHAVEKKDVLSMGFARFVRTFMLVPTQVASTGRRLKLRLLAWNSWQHVFFRALDAVRLVS
jgi:hypothetical protein